MTSKQRYFGEPWPSGLCDEGERVPTPLQASCLWCDEGFAEGERGYFFASGQAVHLECGARMGIGSVGHLKKTCSCHGGNEEDPPGLSKREAAEAAYVEWQRMQLLILSKYARN